MSWTLTTSGAAIRKAGAGMNTIFNQASGATILQNWSDQAESSISASTRRDWVGLSASTLTNFKAVLDDCASDIIALKIINYDMVGYTSRVEAQTMLDVIRDNYVRNLEILKLDQNKEVMIS